MSGTILAENAIFFEFSLLVESLAILMTRRIKTVNLLKTQR